MHAELTKLSERPNVFSVYTTDTLWTDPHLANQMLQFHLSQETILASRPIGAIDQFVDWVDHYIGLGGKTVCDLGCGPGLYATRFAERGAVVQGVDFSKIAIDYAIAHGPSKGAAVSYQVADYLTAPLPDKQDLVTLIYCDFCPLSPEQRQRLLTKIRQALVPGGRFMFDVFSMQAFEVLHEGVSFGHNYMDGFWSAEDYFAFHHTFRYEESAVSLDRYTVIERDRTWDVYNWLQYFSPEGIRAELEQAGFGRIEFIDGFGIDRSDKNSFGVITGI